MSSSDHFSEQLLAHISEAEAHDTPLFHVSRTSPSQYLASPALHIGGRLATRFISDETPDAISIRPGTEIYPRVLSDSTANALHVRMMHRLGLAVPAGILNTADSSLADPEKEINNPRDREAMEALHRGAIIPYVNEHEVNMGGIPESVYSDPKRLKQESISFLVPNPRDALRVTGFGNKAVARESRLTAFQRRVHNRTERDFPLWQSSRDSVGVEGTEELRVHPNPIRGLANRLGREDDWFENNNYRRYLDSVPSWWRGDAP